MSRCRAPVWPHSWPEERLSASDGSGGALAETDAAVICVPGARPLQAIGVAALRPVRGEGGTGFVARYGKAGGERIQVHQHRLRERGGDAARPDGDRGVGLWWTRRRRSLPGSRLTIRGRRALPAHLGGSVLSRGRGGGASDGSGDDRGDRPCEGGGAAVRAGEAGATAGGARSAAIGRTGVPAPAPQTVELVLERRVRVSCRDAFVLQVSVNGDRLSNTGLGTSRSDEAELLTAHNRMDFGRVAERTALLVDT